MPSHHGMVQPECMVRGHPKGGGELATRLQPLKISQYQNKKALIL